MRFILRNRAYEVYESARVPDGPGRRVLRIARNIASHLPQHQRVFARDFLTPFPKNVITPAPGAKIGAMLHNIVPMVGISYEY